MERMACFIVSGADHLIYLLSLRFRYPFQLDYALMMFANAKIRNSLPGLSTLEIRSASDLHDRALIHYLTSMNCLEEQDAAISHREQSGGHLTRNMRVSSFDSAQVHCGYALTSLSLVNTPCLTSASLSAIAQNCPKLRECTFKNVDNIFLPSDKAATAPPPGGQGLIQPEDGSGNGSQASSQMSLLARSCLGLHTLTLSIGLKSIPVGFFDGFEDHPALRTLRITSSNCFTAEHLSSFTTIQRLVVSCCSILTHSTSSIRFDRMPELREFTLLGKGVTVGTMANIWQSCRFIQKVSLDCAEYTKPPSRASIPGRTSRRAAPADDEEGFSECRSYVPRLLRPYRDHNVLSVTSAAGRNGGVHADGQPVPHLPSWALCYLLSLAPPYLESLEMHGRVNDRDCVMSHQSGSATVVGDTTRQSPRPRDFSLSQYYFAAWYGPGARMRTGIGHGTYRGNWGFGNTFSTRRFILGMLQTWFAALMAYLASYLQPSARCGRMQAKTKQAFYDFFTEASLATRSTLPRLHPLEITLASLRKSETEEDTEVDQPVECPQPSMTTSTTSQLPAPHLKRAKWLEPDPPSSPRAAMPEGERRDPSPSSSGATLFPPIANSNHRPAPAGLPPAQSFGANRKDSPSCTNQHARRGDTAAPAQDAPSTSTITLPASFASIDQSLDDLSEDLLELLVISSHAERQGTSQLDGHTTSRPCRLSLAEKAWLHRQTQGRLQKLEV